MSLKLYADEQVDVAISSELLRLGVDILTVQGEFLAGSDDHIVLQRAIALGRVLFTQDEDFLLEAAFYQRNGTYFTGVIYSHQKRLSVGQYVEELELISKICELSEFENRVTYLPLK